MAYVLQASQFAEGLQSYTALLLESIRQISLVSPFNIPDARTALELNQISGNKNAIKAIHSNLGLIYSDMRNFEKALEYFNKSQEFRNEIYVKEMSNRVSPL